MTVSLRILERMSQMMVLEWSTVLWTDTNLSIFCWLTSDLFPRLMVVPQMKHISRSILMEFLEMEERVETSWI